MVTIRFNTGDINDRMNADRAEKAEFDSISPDQLRDGIGTKPSFQELPGVKDANPTQTYSFLPASWAGDTHDETDVLPISDREEKGK